SGATTSVSPALIDLTIRAAASFVTDSPVAAELASTKVIALTKRVLQAMTLTKLKVASALVVTAGVAFTAAGLVAHDAFTAKPVHAQRQEERNHAGQHVDPPAPVANPVRTDQYGDPRPEGAIARTGSIQWRHAGLNCFAFLDSGKTALTAG